MAIFRDLKGRFFSIPESELEKYRLSAAGMASCREGSDASNSTGDTPTIVVNQFFAPLDQVPAFSQTDTGMQSGNDFVAQYTFPSAWGQK